MRIVPYPNFQHEASLRGFVDTLDPREESFVEPAVDLDLRDCEFVRAPAALWCAIFALLTKQRGSQCRLLVPTNIGVCIYLKSMGLFGILQEQGVEADDRGINYREDPQIVLPLTHFETKFDVDDRTNEAHDALKNSGLGSANLYPLVSEVFGELATNAVEHAESPVGAFGFIQFYESQKGQRFTCGVADGGIGIRRSLGRNPALRDRVPYDWSAVELAVKERVSGTLDSTRGIGLYGVAEDMRIPGRSLRIHSGIGSLRIDEELQTDARRTRLFPGTLAYASIPT